MAPEQALAPEQADHRADIYALGCTLYFLLTGKPPFAGTTVIQNVVAHREAAMPSLRQARTDVPAALDAVFLRMVAKKPADRYQSMADVILALERASRKGRQGIIAIGLVALALVGLVAFAFSRFGKPTSGPQVVANVTVTQPIPMQTTKRRVIPTALLVNDPTQDRRVAEMVLGRGGKVTITSKGNLVRVTAAGDLPAEPFRLREIDLIATEVKDADLECVEGLPDLSALRLNHTSISDRGFAHLQNLPSLRLLEVVETRITDDGLKHLANLPSVTWLTLESTFVTDAGLPHLKALPQLRQLRLNRLRLTDQGLVHLEGLTGLRLLEIYETGVTDAGMSSVKKLKNLTWLNLVGTKLTDAGLADLEDLEGLRHLIVARTQVTEAGVKVFQTARPFCKVNP